MLKEISAKGRRVAGVEGDFGSEHKGSRGGVTVEGMGSEGEGEGGVDESALFCCANVTSDCYGPKRLVIGGLV